jgi:predicted amidophosphoribosyltransferase
MKQFLSECVKSICHVLFPPLCLTCGENLKPGFCLFCESCVQALDLLEAEGRCARCFCEKEEHASCTTCRNLPLKLRQQAVCFEESPVSAQLLSLVRHGIAVSAAASYITVQLYKLHWPLPDLIVPTPGDWFDGENGWNSRKALSKELSRILHRPYANCIHLHRHLLPLRHQCLEAQPTFTEALRSSQEATNKVVLLIHDRLSNGRAIALAAQSLQEAGVHSVYAISLVQNL